jgi:hypothetical protein
MVVVAARLLLGKEVVDTQIDEFQLLTDAREAGICEECRKKPALPNHTLCDTCLEECRKTAAEMDRKYGIHDDPQGGIQ